MRNLMDEVVGRFGAVARAISPRILLNLPAQELAVQITNCSVAIVNLVSLVRITCQLANGEDLRIDVLFVRDDVGCVSDTEPTMEERIREEMSHWYVGEVQLDGALTRLLEMTRDECIIGLPELEELYEMQPWEDLPPADDYFLVRDRMQELKDRFDVIQSFSGFFPPSEDFEPDDDLDDESGNAWA